MRKPATRSRPLVEGLAAAAKKQERHAEKGTTKGDHSASNRSGRRNHTLWTTTGNDPSRGNLQLMINSAQTWTLFGTPIETDRETT